MLQWWSSLTINIGLDTPMVILILALWEKNMICVQNHEKGHSQLRTMVLVYLPKHVPENLDVVGKFTST